ncbi:MAG: hypothetical protein JJE07_12175 [Flavobacteriaceae bacterium]|nr:hypothetical protein [Flavobacteriaceae bacterium]
MKERQILLIKQGFNQGVDTFKNEEHGSYTGNDAKNKNWNIEGIFLVVKSTIKNRRTKKSQWQSHSKILYSFA